MNLRGKYKGGNHELGQKLAARVRVRVYPIRFHPECSKLIYLGLDEDIWSIIRVNMRRIFELQSGGKRRPPMMRDKIDHVEEFRHFWRVSELQTAKIASWFLRSRSSSSSLFRTLLNLRSHFLRDIIYLFI